MQLFLLNEHTLSCKNLFLNLLFGNLWSNPKPTTNLSYSIKWIKTSTHVLRGRSFLCGFLSVRHFLFLRRTFEHEILETCRGYHLLFFFFSQRSVSFADQDDRLQSCAFCSLSLCKLKKKKNILYSLKKKKSRKFKTYLLKRQWGREFVHYRIRFLWRC